MDPALIDFPMLTHLQIQLSRARQSAPDETNETYPYLLRLNEDAKYLTKLTDLSG